MERIITDIVALKRIALTVSAKGIRKILQDYGIENPEPALIRKLQVWPFEIESVEIDENEDNPIFKIYVYIPIDMIGITTTSDAWNAVKELLFAEDCMYRDPRDNGRWETGYKTLPLLRKAMFYAVKRIEEQNDKDFWLRTEDIFDEIGAAEWRYGELGAISVFWFYVSCMLFDNKESFEEIIDPYFTETDIIIDRLGGPPACHLSDPEGIEYLQKIWKQTIAYPEFRESLQFPMA